MCIWERSARGSSVSVHVHWTLTIVQGNCAGSQLCKESCETEADNTIFVIQLCATNLPLCNKITLCKSHRATQLCECTTTDYVTVTFSDQATVLPLLPLPPPPQTSHNYLLQCKQWGAGTGRNWESFQSLEYKSKSCHPNQIYPLKTNLTGIATFGEKLFQV